ncbi:MAG TPA: cytochrome c3 family protein, partial [Povalibacter sp.]|nr:cytochrome c3 family protein [Povalibacter sp.]
MTRKKRRRRQPVADATPASIEPQPGPASRPAVLIAIAVIGIAVIAALGVWWSREPSGASRPAHAARPAASAVIEARYVDEAQCAACHATQAGRWHGSHHDLAMQEANDATVLGDFNDSHFVRGSVRTRFFRRDGKLWINTDGPDGKPADFEVKYTFGVEPLQQYLLPLDRGRLQAFTIAWDTQRHRWFDLYPGERIDHRDELHWTRLSQNWNYMCAECHSTDLRKNYDAQTQTYKTTWKQIDVGCQACHGPGSVHLARVRDAATGLGARGDGPEQNSASGQSPVPSPHSSSDFPVDLSSGTAASQIDTCARCHSRRATLWGDYRHGKPLLDTHLPSLLDASLYFVDGQIDGEVYEYGSFLQSKMYRKGLRCSDCHDPHSLQTRAPGNALCVSCHNATTPAARASIDTSTLKHRDYDSPAHHFHRAGQPGSQCVDCHAPQRLYMVVDPRRDHSFRIPRPDLSVKLGTPNACNRCHTQRSAQWAAARVAAWYGPDRRQESTYGEVFWAARTGRPGTVDALSTLAQDPTQPAIARATAMELLHAYPGTTALETFQSQFAAADPLLRLAALNGLEMLPPERLAPLVTPFLDDPVRTVRLDATRLTAAVPASALGPTQRQQLVAGI